MYMKKISIYFLLTFLMLSVTMLKAQDVVVGDTSALSQGKAMELYNNGINQVNSNYLQGAIESFNQAIELYPEFEKAYFNRGSVKFQMKDYQGAMTDINKVVELNPDSNKAHFIRGRI